MSLAGRRALVTGGSRGIGRATAVALARAGVAVGFNYSREEDAAEAEETLGLVRALGVRVHAVRADVADADAVAALVDEMRTTLGGPLEILVNNAAVTHDGLLMMLPESAWDRVIDVNLKGAFLCCRAALRGMIAARFGRIVNVASPAAFFGKEGASSYAAAKGGLVSLTKSLAGEVARFGITVNAVSPGYVETPLIGELTDAARADLVRQIPLGRLAAPDEIAAAIVFLASPSAAYLTGTTVHVDGGLTML
jgi:3-oxoacyl-[acyl-carrier protein] reductase